LPEITEHGRHGFLVGSADPESICETMLEAMSDPARLSRMGTSGQRHVVRNYSWERTARRIAEIVARG
jgi:glycosyltransferase involved in cell wall biosynthesis